MRRDSRKNSKWKMALAPLGAATLLALSVCTAYTRADAASAATSIPEESTAEEDKDNSGSSTDDAESSEQQGSGAGEEETEQQTQGSDAASGSAQSAQDDSSAPTDAEQTSGDDKASSAKETDASTEAATEETATGTTDAAVEASTEPEEAADAADTDDEDLNDAMTLTCSLDDGTEITADIPEGAFPAGVEMKAEREDSASYEAAIEDVAADNEEASSDDNTITQYAAFDITFYLPADPDTELEPEKPISLTFSNVDVDSFDQEKDADKEQSSSAEDRDSSSDKNGSDTDDQAVSDSTRLTVWHVEDDGTDAQQLDTDNYSILKDRLSATVQADQFSTYVLRLSTAVSDAVAGTDSGVTFTISNAGESLVYRYNDNIYLYCMNDKLTYPAANQVYTISDDLLSKDVTDSAAYSRLIRELKIILYAGYPYNGLNLYNVVSSSDQTDADQVTNDDITRMLVVPDEIKNDFSDILGDAVYTSSDYRDKTAQNYKNLLNFINTVNENANEGRKTVSGIEYSQIMESTFYKAADSIILAAYQNSTPADIYNAYYSNVTEEQAYKQTNIAIWHLMSVNSVANNDSRYRDTFNSSQYPLAKALVKAAQDKDITIPEKEPDAGIIIDGSSEDNLVKKSYYSNGNWYSDYLTIQAPDDGWHVIYRIEGAKTDDGRNYVSSGESFRLLLNEKSNPPAMLGRMK